MRCPYWALILLCGYTACAATSSVPVKVSTSLVTRIPRPIAVPQTVPLNTGNSKPQATVSPVRSPTNTFQVASLQTALDRNGFGVGLIDGREGSKTTMALKDYALSRGITSWQARKELLADAEPVTNTYVLTDDDLAQIGSAPADYLEASVRPSMACESLEEVIAETFHVSPTFLKRLNPAITNWAAVAAGTELTIPNTRPADWSSPASHLEVDCNQYRVRAFDENGSIIASFPCSIAKKLHKVPVGDLTIVSFAPNPNYTFDPDNFPESPRAQEIGKKLIIPPGPNNPVGVYWLTLSAAGFGMHGTPHPETIGRRESHGCFRLPNWDITTLASMIEEGTPVTVKLDPE